MRLRALTRPATIAVLAAGATACNFSGGSGGSGGNGTVDIDHSDDSLYAGPGPRPGPDILYAGPADAPQLQNTGVWEAPPILVSGASAYRDGEFLYQDFLYDDHGAVGILPDPGDPRTGDNIFSRPAGTYTYPTAAVYAHNAADLVEFRVKPLDEATAFRVTLNTLLDPGKVAFTLAIGDSGAARAWPHGANVGSPAAWFLTVHGEQAELIDAATGDPAAAQPTVAVDLERRQYDIRVPHAAFDPGRSTLRLALGVGLWNAAAGAYLVPEPVASATVPGGSGVLPQPPAFFNMGFRFAEPWPDVTRLLDTAVTPAWWRDRAQAEALAAGDVGRFAVEVDFGRLADGVDDDMPGQPQGVPRTGPMNRILASHSEPQQGAVYPSGCGGAGQCQGSLRGRLQPYAIYVPEKPAPEDGYGLTLLMHSLGANYNQYSGSRNQSQLGERGDGHIVITPAGRGPDGWYVEHAGADTFEVWADVARRYRLDPARAAATGYSMGGYGTFRFVTRFPDLFGKAQTTVGPPAIGIWLPPGEPSGGAQSNSAEQLAGFRNVPVMMWVMVADELVPYPSTVEQANRLDALGYRYVFDSFAAGEHLTLAVNDQYAPVAAFLGDSDVDRDPRHVSYTVNPAMDFPDVGMVGDHAYWLSGIEPRGDGQRGTIDVFSHGFGAGDPEPDAPEVDAGTLDGGTIPAIPFTRQSRAWGDAPSLPVADRLDIEAANIGAVTVYPGRARVSCDAELNVATDGPVAVTLAGCDRTSVFGG